MNEKLHAIYLYNHLDNYGENFIAVCPVQLNTSWADGYTQRNLFEILLNQTEIRLYLPFSD